MRYGNQTLHNASSLDKVLVFSTVTIFALHMIITIISFQHLPPLPTLEDLVFPNKNNANSDAQPLQKVAKMEQTDPFPQSVHDLPFETMLHPAVEIVPDINLPNLTVPAFYDPPRFEKHNGVRSYLGNYGESLMTKEQALSIGSVVNGQETIFVAIASYRDFQCRQTIESIFSRAAHPERIRVAVVDQIDKGDVPCSQPEYSCESDPQQVLCKYRESGQLDFFTMEAQYAMGPVFARHLGNRMYRGEYYAIQCDARKYGTTVSSNYLKRVFGLCLTNFSKRCGFCA